MDRWKLMVKLTWQLGGQAAYEVCLLALLPLRQLPRLLPEQAS